MEAMKVGDFVERKGTSRREKRLRKGNGVQMAKVKYTTL